MKYAVMAGTLAVLGGISSASAAPLAVSAQAIQSEAHVTHVRYGCGRGWTPNRWGNCSRVEEAYGYRGGYGNRQYGGYGRQYGGYGRGYRQRDGY